MDFRLNVFVSVARNRSFTKASRELFISQPAITKHIQELEMQYKTPLFERTRNQVCLTRAGELLLSHATGILQMYNQLDFEMHMLTDHLSGQLHLGASTTIAQYVLPPVLASFIRKFPDIRLSLMNGNSGEIEHALAEGKISLGLVEGNTRRPGLHYAPFVKDELVVVTRTANKHVRQEEITLEQLCSLPLVLRENGSGTLDVLEAALSAHHVRLSSLRVLMQLGSTESIKLFLQNSDCLGIISVRAVREELMAGKLRIVDVKGFTVERMFSFVLRQGQNGGLEERFIRFAGLNAGL